jgi:hypothetical protein
MVFQVRYGRPPRDDPVELAAPDVVLTDAELASTVRETYRGIVARYDGTTEEAMRTCTALLRIHRRPAMGSRTAHAWIAKMLKDALLRGGETNS